MLAWLLDRSALLAREFIRRYFADDSAALASVEEPGITIGARTWGTLQPVDGTGHLYPDLIVAGSDRSFELIVEIKVDAELHWWDLPNGTRLYQPDAYALSWERNYDPALEARIRRVGTLTRTDVTEVASASALRTTDVRWDDVRELLSDAQKAGTIEPHVNAVAADAIAAIDDRILHRKEHVSADDPVIAWGYTFLGDFAPAIAARLSGGELKQVAAIRTDFASAYVYFDTEYGEKRLWLYATPAEGKYSCPGFGDALWISEDIDLRWPEPLRKRVSSAGINDLRDHEGFRGYRLALDIAEIRAVGSLTAQVQHALELTNSFLAALR